MSMLHQEPPTDFDNDTLEMLEEKVPKFKEDLKDLTSKRNLVQVEYFVLVSCYMCIFLPYFQMQLECDTVDNFRAMTAAEVERLGNASKMRDLELGELMENHRVELEVYAHKVCTPYLLL